MDVDPRLERRAIRAVLIAFGTIITEGPVGRFISGWSPRTAMLAWSLLIAAVIGLFSASVAFERRPVAKVFLVGAGLIALVMVFAGYVRNEVKREREQHAFRLSQRGRRSARAAPSRPARPPANEEL